MAVTAKFVADFRDFNAGVDDASRKLEQFGGATQHAGESTGLLGGILESATEFAVGLGEAFSVEKIIEFGFGALESASKIDELSRATGVSREALQRMSYVTEAFGVTMEDIGRGIEQFSTRLARGDNSATAAVEKLGFSVKDLIASGPENAFLAFADAVSRVEDPMTKDGIASDALGTRLAKILLPALRDLRTAMNDVPKTAIISDENIDKAKKFDEAMSHAGTVARALAVDGFGLLATMIKGTIPGFKDAQEAQDQLSTSMQGFVGPQQQVLTNADLLKNRLSALRSEALLPLTDAQKTAIVELESYGVSHKEIADLVGTSEGAIKRYNDSLRQQEKDVHAAAAAAKEYDAIIAHMDKETFTLAMEHEKQWRAEQLVKTKLVNEAVLAELDAQVKLNAAYGLTADGALKQSSATETLRQALDALHLKKVEGISQEKEEQVLINAYTDALLEEARAQDEVNQAVSEMPQAVGSADASMRQFTGTLVLGIKDLSQLNAALSDFYDQFSGSNVGTPEVAGFNTPVIAPLGGRRIPGTPGGAGVINNTFNVNGTAQDAARQIMDIITQSMRQTRQFPAS
jgi:predicted transcriptional regulator